MLVTEWHQLLPCRLGVQHVSSKAMREVHAPHSAVWEVERGCHPLRPESGKQS